MLFSSIKKTLKTCLAIAAILVNIPNIKCMVEFPATKVLSKSDLNNIAAENFKRFLNNIALETSKYKGMNPYSNESIAVFYSNEIPQLNISDYFDQLNENLILTPDQISMAQKYIAEFVIQTQSFIGVNIFYAIHRIVFTAILLAIKNTTGYYYYAEDYARCGKINVEELDTLIKSFIEVLQSCSYLSKEKRYTFDTGIYTHIKCEEIETIILGVKKYLLKKLQLAQVYQCPCTHCDNKHPIINKIKSTVMHTFEIGKTQNYVRKMRKCLEPFHAEQMRSFNFSDYFDSTAGKVFFSPEDFVLATILIDRLISKALSINKQAITTCTIHRIFSTALILARTYNDDYRISKKEFEKDTSIMNAEQLRLELSFLSIIEFNLSVSSQEWDQYLTELTRFSKLQISNV